MYLWIIEHSIEVLTDSGCFKYFRTVDIRFCFVICENNSYNENQSKHLTIVKNNVVIFSSSQSLEYSECTSVELHLKT